jgi:hypothetical protein
MLRPIAIKSTNSFSGCHDSSCCAGPAVWLAAAGGALRGAAATSPAGVAPCSCDSFERSFCSLWIEAISAIHATGGGSPLRGLSCNPKVCSAPEKAKKRMVGAKKTPRKRWSRRALIIFMEASRWMGGSFASFLALVPFGATKRSVPAAKLISLLSSKSLGPRRWELRGHEFIVTRAPAIASVCRGSLRCRQRTVPRIAGPRLCKTNKRANNTLQSNRRLDPASDETRRPASSTRIDMGFTARAAA